MQEWNELQKQNVSHWIELVIACMQSRHCFTAETHDEEKCHSIIVGQAL